MEKKYYEVKGGEYTFPAQTRGYLIGKPEDVQLYRSEEGWRLEALDIKSGDALLTWYRDPSDHDDDFDCFDVFPGEVVFAIRKK